LFDHTAIERLGAIALACPMKLHRRVEERGVPHVNPRDARAEYSLRDDSGGVPDRQTDDGLVPPVERATAADTAGLRAVESLPK
jgi:hypothetical protein